MNDSNIYSNWQLCDTLRPNEKCFRALIYNGSSYKDLLHEHVPKHRLNLESGIYLLKNLLTKYSEWNASMIINNYLNNRKGNPKVNRLIQMPVEYPEAGVLRRFCSSGDVIVWMDEVVNPELFRNNS